MFGDHRIKISSWTRSLRNPSSIWSGPVLKLTGSVREVVNHVLSPRDNNWGLKLGIQLNDNRGLNKLRL